MNTNSFDTKKYNLILSVIFLSLFVTIRFETGFILIRPFDLICLIVFPFVLLLRGRQEEISKGFFYLLPFLIIHILSASIVGINNLIRELLQILIILIFAFTLSTFKTRIDCQKTFNISFLGSLIILFAVIWWHYSYGIWARGWKQLPDSKAIFTIITILTFIYIIFFKKKKINDLVILLFILLPILLLSGERKALLIFIFLLVLKYSPGFSIKTVFMLFLIYFFLIILSVIIENPYLYEKINTTLNIMQTGNINYFLSTGFMTENDTISNLQRAFSFRVSKEYFIDNPIFGVGTNNYKIMVFEQYPQIVEYRSGALAHGIHGEFQRVLVENGLIGLIVYFMIWYKSWHRSKIILNEVLQFGKINKTQLNFCLYGIYLSIALFVGTEASSTKSFIFLAIIALLPDYYIHHYSLKKNN